MMSYMISLFSERLCQRSISAHPVPSQRSELEFDLGQPKSRISGRSNKTKQALNLGVNNKFRGHWIYGGYFIAYGSDKCENDTHERRYNEMRKEGALEPGVQWCLCQLRYHQKSRLFSYAGLSCPLCHQGYVIFGSSRGKSVSLPFLSSRHCLTSLAHDPILHLWSWKHSIFQSLLALCLYNYIALCVCDSPIYHL